MMNLQYRLSVDIKKVNHAAQQDSYMYSRMLLKSI